MIRIRDLFDSKGFPISIWFLRKDLYNIRREIMIIIRDLIGF